MSKGIDVYHSVAMRWGISPQKVMDFASTFIASKGGTVPAAKVVEFMMVCDAHGLNPATKEVAAFYDANKGLTTFVMVDGWIKLANQHPDCDGWEFEEQLDDNGKVIAVRCHVYRKDRTRPITTPWMHLNEWKVSTSPQWSSKPGWMLSMKALKHGARMAFGFAGLYDSDEVEEIHQVKVETAAPKVVEGTIDRPSKASKIAASVKVEKSAGEVENEDSGVVPEEDTVRPLKSTAVNSESSPADSTDPDDSDTGTAPEDGSPVSDAGIEDSEAGDSPGEDDEEPSESAPASEFAEVFRSELSRCKVTQKAVAECLGWAQSAISNIANGKQGAFQKEQLDKLCGAFPLDRKRLYLAAGYKWDAGALGFK